MAKAKSMLTVERVSDKVIKVHVTNEGATFFRHAKGGSLTFIGRPDRESFARQFIAALGLDITDMGEGIGNPDIWLDTRGQGFQFLANVGWGTKED